MDGLRIVVVGGGIGGVCAALALEQAGYEVEVYERAPAILPIGAGLCMWCNGAKALNALGLERALGAISPELGAVQFLTRDGELLSDIPMAPLVAATGQRPYPVARAELQGALVSAFGAERIHLGAECIGVEQSAAGATAHFADGRSASGDLVIGADGIRSVVRPHVVAESTVRSLSWDWEGITTVSLGAPDAFVFHVADGKRAATMPVGDGRFYYFFDFEKPPALPGMRAQLRTLFDGWCEPVQRLVEAVPEAGASHLHHHDLDPIAAFARGRVVLIGDAAHATTPFLGQGASQAAEDALVLARYLRTTSVSIVDALERYQRERMERVHAIVRGAREKGEAATMAGTDANERYYEELRNGSRDFVEAVEHFTRTGPLR